MSEAWRLLALLVLLACSAPSRAAPVVDTITWLSGDTLAMRDGGTVVRPSDRMLGWLAERLPYIAHKRVVANAKRSWMLIQGGEPVCHVGAVRTAERERLAYFSNTSIMPPLQLVVRAQQRGAVPVDASGQVDLAALLASPELRGVMVHGRSYGPVLDSLLARHQHSPALRSITTGDFGSNLMPMLMQGKADYAIEYPNALAALKQLQPEAQSLVTLPIRGATDPVIAGVACPRTPWGQAAIHLIDRTLGTPEGAGMLRESLLAQTPVETERSYRDQMDSFFQRRSQPTPGL